MNTEMKDATPDSPVTCLKCGTTAVQLLSVPKRNIGAALFAELLGGTAAGVTAGQKNVALNTCMKCGAQWVPGATETLEQIRARKLKDEELSLPATLSIFAVVAIIILAFIAKACQVAG